MVPEHPLPGHGTCSCSGAKNILPVLLQAGSCSAGSAGTWVAATGQRGCRGSDGNHSGSGGQAGCGEAEHLASSTVLTRVRQGWVFVLGVVIREFHGSPVVVSQQPCTA